MSTLDIDTTLKLISIAALILTIIGLSIRDMVLLRRMRDE